MPSFTAAPAFGARLNTLSYYENIKSIISVLRPMSSLRTIANHLNAQGFMTPTGLEWNRDRLANHIRTSIKS